MKRKTSAPLARGLEIKVRGAAAPSGNQWVRVRKGNRSTWLPRFEFMLDPRAIKQRLASSGLFLSGPEFAELEQLVAKLSVFPPRRLLEQPGWTMGCYVLPNGRVFAPTRSRAVVLFQADPRRCTISGSLLEWLAVVGQLQGQHLAVFMLMAAFIAPVLEFTDRSGNIGFELCGRPGNGKTTLLQLMASVVGRAVPSSSEPTYFSSCNTTVNALENTALAHRDLPLLLDDATLFAAADRGLSRASQFKHFVFSLAQGETKARHLAPQHRFRTVYVLTTNVPLGDVIADLAAAEAGATADRLLSLNLDLSVLGNFEFLPNGFADTRAFAQQLIQGVATQFGSALPHFLEQLVRLRAEDESGLRDNIGRRVDEFLTMVSADKFDGSAIRVAEAFGLARVAGRLAQHFGALPAEFDCDSAAVTAYQLYQATVQRMSPLERLHAFVRNPGVRDLDGEGTGWLTFEEITNTPGFWKISRNGDREFRVWPALFKAAFADWKRVIDDPAVSALMRRGDGKHIGEKRHMCRDRPNDRFFCFKFPRRQVRSRRRKR